MGIGWQQILLIVLIVVLLFGAKRIPQLMGDVAKGIKSFKKGMRDEDEQEDASQAPQARVRDEREEGSAASERKDTVAKG